MSYILLTYDGIFNLFINFKYTYLELISFFEIYLDIEFFLSSSGI